MHDNVLQGVFLLIFSLPLLMTFTSLAQPLSFILFLTIFFFSWFQQGSWSSLVSVWISHLLVCLLIFVAHQTTLGFWASCLGLLLFFSFPTRCIKQGCSPCRGACKVKGCLNCFWDPFLKCFAQKPSYPFYWHQFASFDLTFMQVFGRLLGQVLWIACKPPSCTNSFFSPSLMGGLVAFPQSSFALITYLGSWTFIAYIIAVKFLC